MPPSPFSIRPALGGQEFAAVAGLFRPYAESLGVDFGYQDCETEIATIPGRCAPPAGALISARGPKVNPWAEGRCIRCNWRVFAR